MKDSLIGGMRAKLSKGILSSGETYSSTTHMGSSAPRAAHNLWKEKPMLQYLITAMLRALNLECVDLFGRHYRCTNACLVHWIKQYEVSQQ